MHSELTRLLILLEDSIVDEAYNEDLWVISCDVVEEIKEQEEDPLEAVESIFKLMEKYPDVEFGQPGPIVHFVENQYKNGYEEKLVESINRQPTKQTIWMLNRVIVNAHRDDKAYFIDVMKRVAASSDLDEETVSLARHYQSLYEE